MQNKKFEEEQDSGMGGGGVMVGVISLLNSYFLGNFEAHRKSFRTHLGITNVSSIITHPTLDSFRPKFVGFGKL